MFLGILKIILRVAPRKKGQETAPDGSLHSTHTMQACVLYVSQEQTATSPCTAQTAWVFNTNGVCLLRGTNRIFKYISG